MHFANEPTIIGAALCHKMFPNTWANLNDRNYFGIMIFNARQRIPTFVSVEDINTLRTGDADLRFYVTNVQDG